MRGDILFISDLHLSPLRPQKVALFCDLLKHGVQCASHVYILGDLFDFLAGDDDCRHPVPAVFAAIAEAVQSGLKVDFMLGNREFMVGHGVAARSGMALLRDPSLVQHHGMRILLSHGDAFCTSDVAYMRFRRFMGRPLVQSLMRALPLRLLHAMSDSHRRRADAPVAKRNQVDVTAAAVEAAMAEHQAQVLVHGHTHRPGVHAHTAGGRTVVRYVLGDWIAGDSLLLLRDGQFIQQRVRDWMAA